MNENELNEAIDRLAECWSVNRHFERVILKMCDKGSDMHKKIISRNEAVMNNPIARAAIIKAVRDDAEDSIERPLL